jgi:hypothetical protein
MRKRTSSNLPLPELDVYRSGFKGNTRLHYFVLFAFGLLLGMWIQPRVGIFSSINHEIASWKHKHTGNRS